MKRFVSSLLSIAFAIGIFAASSTITTSEAYAISLRADKTITAYQTDSEKTFAVNNDLFSFKTYTQTEGKASPADFSAIEITLSPYSNPGGFLLQKHVVDAPEDFYVEEGEFEFLGFQPNKSISVSEGDVVRIPAGVPYGYKNTGSKPGKVLLISPSDGLENFVAEIGTPVEDPTSVLASTADLSTDTVQTDINKLAVIAEKYGIEFLN